MTKISAFRNFPMNLSFLFAEAVNINIQWLPICESPGLVLFVPFRIEAAVSLTETTFPQNELPIVANHWLAPRFRVKVRTMLATGVLHDMHIIVLVSLI